MTRTRHRDSKPKHNGSQWLLTAQLVLRRQGSQETSLATRPHPSYPGRSECHRPPASHLCTRSPEVTPALSVLGRLSEPLLPFSAAPETTGNPLLAPLPGIVPELGTYRNAHSSFTNLILALIACFSRKQRLKKEISHMRGSAFL